MSHFDCVSEIRAGNFLFNDLTIYKKGLCERKDLACVLKAVVISKFDDDSRFVLHCGSVHLSKENIQTLIFSMDWFHYLMMGRLRIL